MSPDSGKSHENVVGRLEVPSGESFSVEISLDHDNPLWSVTLEGKTAAGIPYSRPVGQNESHVIVPLSVPDGSYGLMIFATLQAPRARFTLSAKSSVDQERRELITIAGMNPREDVLQVLVG